MIDSRPAVAVFEGRDLGACGARDRGRGCGLSWSGEVARSVTEERAIASELVALSIVKKTRDCSSYFTDQQHDGPPLALYCSRRTLRCPASATARAGASATPALLRRRDVGAHSEREQQQRGGSAAHRRGCSRSMAGQLHGRAAAPGPLAGWLGVSPTGVQLPHHGLVLRRAGTLAKRLCVEQRQGYELWTARWAQPVFE